MWYEYIKVCRPLNCFLTVVAVIIGGIASQGSQNAFLSGSIICSDLLNLFIGATGAGLIAAGGYVINDIFDVEIDKINSPSRPIAKGAISLSNARKYVFLLFGLGLTICFLTFNLLTIITSLCATYLLYRYSTDLKRGGLAGNLTVAILAFILFFYGGILTSNPIYALFPASFAFLLILAREIIKDVEDIRGDKCHECLTFPIRYGINKSILIARILLGMLTIIAFLPFFLGIYPTFVYLLFISINVSFIVAVIFFLREKPEIELILAAKSAKKLLKWCMVLGILGFFISSIIPIF